MTPRWYFARWLGWFLFTLLGFKVIGRERVPKTGPLIIAANHASYLDPPLVGYAVNRECCFMAKRGLFEGVKFFTWLITFYNAFPITGAQTIRRALWVLERGLALVIFPEGTRGQTGTLLPFHPGVGYLARKVQSPVIPVYLANSHRAISRLILRRYHLTVVIGDPLSPPPPSADRAGDELFVNQLRHAINEIAAPFASQTETR